jgi:GAF domain-containing protein
VSSKRRNPISENLRSAVERLAEAPQRTFSMVTGQLGGANLPVNRSSPPPPHVTSRLESAFEALSELSFRPHVGSALELALDVLQAELPSEAMAAGLYDINADEILFVTARGEGHDMLRGTTMPRVRCLCGRAAEHAIITDAAPGAADWIGARQESSVLLCPILDDTTLLGVLALSDPTCAVEYTQHDAELARYVAGQLAGYIRSKRQRPPAPVAPPPPKSV